MTLDKFEVATKGHGSLVIPVYCAVNSHAENVFCSMGSSDMELLSHMTLVDAALVSFPPNPAGITDAGTRNSAIIAQISVEIILFGSSGIQEHRPMHTHSTRDFRQRNSKGEFP
jgi:hypothetical protein